MAKQAKNYGLLLWPWLAAILLWLSLYYPRLPVSVQGGDTPEIVTAAKLLTVAHPPGYPLLLWLFHAGDAVLRGPSVYWNCAFVASLFSLLTLGFIFTTFRRSPALGLLGVAAFATSRLFWKFSVLPDVFSLHWMMVAAALMVYLETSIRSEVKRLWLLSLIFGLSFANHHTTFFLAPLWIHQIKVVRKPKQIFASLGLGAAISAAFYLSILLMDRCNILSWGCIDSFSGLVKHFMRDDYGTFKLASGEMEVEFWKCLWYLTKIIVSDLTVPLIFVGALVVLTHRNRQEWSQPWRSLDVKTRVIALTGAIYVTVFFSLSNIKLRDFGAEVFDRFTVMPTLIFLVVILRVAEHFLRFSHLKARLQSWVKKPPFRLGFLLLLISSYLVGFLKYGLQNDFSHRVVLEEYIKNYLRQDVPDPSKKTIVTAMSDSTLFALYYGIGVLKLRDDFYIVNTGNFHKGWSRRLYRRNIPGIVMTKQGADDKQDSAYTYIDFIADNLGKFNFLAEADVTDPAFAYRFGAVGRFVLPGSGVSFVDESKLKITTTADWSSHYVPDYSRYDTDLKIYSKYAHYYLAKGLAEFRKKNLKGAVAQFEKGLEIVPYCQPCLANKCFALSAGSGAEHKECFALLKKMSKDYANYFSGQPFTGVQPVKELPRSDQPGAGSKN